MPSVNAMYAQIEWSQFGSWTDRRMRSEWLVLAVTSTMSLLRALCWWSRMCELLLQNFQNVRHKHLRLRVVFRPISSTLWSEAPQRWVPWIIRTLTAEDSSQTEWVMFHKLARNVTRTPWTLSCRRPCETLKLPQWIPSQWFQTHRICTSTKFEQWYVY